ncbi:diguanylate cyclase domain-containing protein [Rhodoferax sp.]|uniref:diguanylate cyclase domain-containing protein n=1 Tax=Rhodoferax sp. TaxID=50421 RepID=UPI00276EE379|nr:diguanylate cyclase [Rhodoferax sp.]
MPLSIGELVTKPSIGVAFFPRDGTTVRALIKSADTAMHKAKQSVDLSSSHSPRA